MFMVLIQANWLLQNSMPCSCRTEVCTLGCHSWLLAHDFLHKTPDHSLKDNGISSCWNLSDFFHLWLLYSLSKGSFVSSLSRIISFLTNLVD